MANAMARAIATGNGRCHGTSLSGPQCTYTYISHPSPFFLLSDAHDAERYTMRDEITTAIEIIGLALVVVGLGRIDPTIGIIAAGLILVGLGYLLGRR